MLQISSVVHLERQPSTTKPTKMRLCSGRWPREGCKRTHDYDCHSSQTRGAARATAGHDRDGRQKAPAAGANLQPGCQLLHGQLPGHAASLRRLLHCPLREHLHARVQRLRPDEDVDEPGEKVLFPCESQWQLWVATACSPLCRAATTPVPVQSLIRGAHAALAPRHGLRHSAASGADALAVLDEKLGQGTPPPPPVAHMSRRQSAGTEQSVCS